MPIARKMDLKELYILSFYFHAFDFIIRTKYGFTKKRKEKNQVDSWFRRVTSAPPTYLRDGCSILRSRVKTFFLFFLSVRSASQLRRTSLHKNNRKD